MQLSAEVLDHIFSFLVSSHRRTLVACSKDPVLSPIVERHLYHYVIVHIALKEAPDSKHTDTGTFTPDRLSKLVSEKPRILNHVRKLQIQLEFFRYSWRGHSVAMQLLDHFAKTFVMFPNLECIILSNSPEQIESHWQWSDVFRTALEDRLSLGTVTELHLIGSEDFPHSLLDNCKNVKNLTLSGDFSDVEVQVCHDETLLPQLRSLTFCFDVGISSSLLAWSKLHISQLRSVKCTMSTTDQLLLSALLGVCPPTLRKLDVDIKNMQYCSEYSYPTGQIIRRSPILEISPIPSKPQLELTIRTIVAFAESYDADEPPECCMSWLPAAAEAIKSFIPSLQRLVLDIDVHLSTVSELTEIDFSPLAILGAASLSIPRIDLYVHTGVLPSAVTRAQLLTVLEGYDGIAKSIEEGVLVIYSEKKALDE